jgi:hypothetical protein
MYFQLILEWLFYFYVLIIWNIITTAIKYLVVRYLSFVRRMQGLSWPWRLGRRAVPADVMPMLIISCKIQTDSCIQLVFCQIEYRKVYLPGPCSPTLLHRGTPKIIVHIPRNPTAEVDNGEPICRHRRVGSPTVLKEHRHNINLITNSTEKKQRCWPTEVIPILPTTGQKLSPFCGIFSCGATALLGAKPSHYWGCESTHRHTTSDRTPPD